MNYEELSDKYENKLTYEELCRKLISQDVKERIDAELEILGRFYYLND